MNHWENDPWKNLGGIRVAVDGDQIIGTVRVFIRQMYLRGHIIPVGGIGEVSTREEYRRRGIATQLLKDAIRFMEEREIVLSCLRGSRPIYEALGWEAVGCHYAVARRSSSYVHDFDIRRVDLDDEAELRNLDALYHSYSRRFNGTFLRNEAYWRHWFCCESSEVWSARDGEEMVGYISVNVDGSRVNVREFATSDGVFDEDGGRHVFNALVAQALSTHDTQELDVVWPAPVAGGFDAPQVNESRSTKYRFTRADKLPVTPGELPSLISQQPGILDQGIPSHHVFWNTDGY